jgi:pimeloyl-ACP methyl ester carboxylesterase
MNKVVANHLERAAVDGLELEYELHGSGEPVVLIHWGLCAAWAEPLMEEPVLAERYRLLNYHRAGFAGSDRIKGPVSMADHASHCALLLRHLGIERAHVVGHSSSAVIALQLALDFPDVVHSLALMEPARPTPPMEEQAQFVRDFVAPALQRYRAGDKAGAVDAFARGVFGSDYRHPLERGFPGVLKQAVADADAFFAQELPALQQWSFTQGEASRITQPALGVLGEHTVPTFPERMELLVSWLPNVEPFELRDATHLLHLGNPRGMAEGLASFFARHPLRAPGPDGAARCFLRAVRAVGSRRTRRMAVDLVIDIENTPGALAQVAAAISDAGVNIAAATCIGGGERAELHILVPHAGAAKHSLAISHLAVTREREVVVVEVEDRPGVLADLTRKIARAGVDLDLVYVATRNRVVFGARDLAGLRAALDATG